MHSFMVSMTHDERDANHTTTCHIHIFVFEIILVGCLSLILGNKTRKYNPTVVHDIN